MLISGPSEWSEVTLAPKASKTNLLQHGMTHAPLMYSSSTLPTHSITRFGAYYL